MASHRLVVAALGAGAISGAVVALALSSWMNPSEREKPRADRSSNTNPAVPRAGSPQPAERGMGDVKRKLSHVEQRLEELEERADKPKDEPVSAVEHPTEPPAEVLYERFANTIREHKAEPIDPTWAPTMNRELTKDLERVTKYTGVAISDVDCRSTSCTATAQWKDRGEASSDYGFLLSFPFRVNCERTVLLPPHTEGETTVSASLVLNCESWRAEGSEMMPEETIASFSLPPRPTNQ